MRIILLIFILIFIKGLNANAQDIRMFIFGHSLIDHRPPTIPTPSNETTIPHWLYLLAEEAGKSFAAGGQYGFLPQHARTPPISQWGYDIVPGVWESDTETFTEADITTALITAGNFVQWQGPDEEYPSDPGVTPISATVDITDWLIEQEEEMNIYIYENWPDMAGFLNTGFPPSQDEFISYNEYLNGDFHRWWLKYHDALLSSRADLNIRMIPVGPVISQIQQQLVPDIPLNEWYEDDAPHGRPNIYFLSALITYAAIYQERPPVEFDIPDIIHHDIIDHYAEIIDLIWSELLAFNDNNGDNRVFLEDMTSNDIDVQIDYTVKLFPNPTTGHLLINSSHPISSVSFVDNVGRLILEEKNKKILDINNLQNGMYHVIIQLYDGSLIAKKILKH